MAKAAVDLSEHVTCPVCYEVFEDPLILKCLHTVCGGCVRKLQRFNVIVCPVCRDKCPMNQVKSDFKTKALLELHNGSTKKTSTKSPSTSRTTQSSRGDPRFSLPMCGLCKKQEIATYCQQCKILICAECKMSHSRIPSCKKHTFGLQTYRKDQITALKSAATGLENTGIGNAREQQEFENKVSALETQASEEIKAAETKALAAVKQHHQSLLFTVRQRKLKILGTRAKQTEELKALALDVQGRIEEYAQEVLSSEHGEVTVENIVSDSMKILQFQQELTRIKKKYSTESCACRTVIHVKEEDYNDETGTKVMFKERVSKCVIQ